MGNITPQDLSNGVRIEMSNDAWTVIEFQHVKPGKGGAFVRTKIRSLTTGRVIDKTFRGSEKIVQADVEINRMQYVYREGDDFVLMDLQTYEQSNVPGELLGDGVNFLKEGDEISVVWWNGKAVNIDLPPKAELKVVETMPGEKGNTATQATKPAKLETGFEVQVPLFINEGDIVRVDTRDGKYEERV